MNNILASSSKIRERSPDRSIPASPQNGSAPKLGTKKEQEETRILQILGILVVTAVITAGFMIAGMGWVLSSVQAVRVGNRQRESIGTGTEPESKGGIRLSGRIGRCGPLIKVEHAWASPGA